MKHISRLIAVLIIPILLMMGCAKRMPLEEMRPVEAFRYLVGKYENGEYISAIEGFEFFTLNFSGNALVDSAWFILAESHFAMKEYLLAADSYDRLTVAYPRSPLVPEAMFNIGNCYWKMSPKYSLDQQYTQLAIDAFQTFIDFFPDHVEKIREAEKYIGECRDKLGHKVYASAVIYYRMKDYISAERYFRRVVEEFYDTQWAPMAAFQIGSSLQKAEQYEDAILSYEMYMMKYPDHEWNSKAESAIKESRSAMIAVEDDGE